MPFLTEELWQMLPRPTGIRSIALDGFPEARFNRIDPVAENKFFLLQRIITSVRTARADNKRDPREKVAAEFSSQDGEVIALVKGQLESLQRLAVLSNLRVTSDRLSGDGYFHSLPEGDIHIPFSEIASPQAEVARLNKEIEGLRKAIISKERQLGNETFRSRAPEIIVRKLEETLATQKIELKKVEERLGQL
jgi:valyl-tRNA synthetase